MFPQHSQQLYEKANGPKQILLLPNAGHAADLILPQFAECAGAIRRWFDQTLR